VLYSQLKVNPVCCTLCLREGKVDPVFASKLGDVSNATRHLKRVHTEQWDEYDKKRKEAGLPAHTRVPAAAAARADASRAVSPKSLSPCISIPDPTPHVSHLQHAT
jgi:hypothetical protein